MLAQDNEQTTERAVRIVGGGGVIGYRTDTFYGLGASPFAASAVQTIRTLKGREDSKAILIIVSDETQIERFIAERSELFRSLSRQFWPGPLTIVGPARPEVSAELTSGTGTIGLRLPDDAGLRKLVRRCGGALTATSANRSGQPPARTADEVLDYFGDSLELIIDGGEVTIAEPSTVVDATGEKLRIIREGVISKEELQSFAS